VRAIFEAGILPDAESLPLYRFKASLCDIVCSSSRRREGGRKGGRDVGREVSESDIDSGRDRTTEIQGLNRDLNSTEIQWHSTGTE
jgi:hypothetical protein